MKARSGVILGLAALALFAAAAPAFAISQAPSFAMLSPTVAKVDGDYKFSCTSFTRFPGLQFWYRQAAANPNLYISPGPYIQAPGGCPGGYVYMFFSFPAGGNPFVIANSAASGKFPPLVAKLPSTFAAGSDSLVDSLAISVNRSVSNQVTIGISGSAKHYNSEISPDGAISSLKIVVYPDSNAYNAQTGAVATGEIRFYGNSKVITHGIINSSDVTSITSVGSNGFRVGAIAGLSKTVTGVSNVNAVVQAIADPNGVDSVLPASNPLLLSLLAALLLGGATWLLTKRSRATFA